MKIIGLVIGCFSLLFLVGACASKVELSPAEGARTTNAMTAVSAVKGVHVAVEAEAWSHAHDADIAEYVTPLRVSIENNSGQAIRIQYKQFALVDAKGKRYAAIPPLKIDEKVEEPISTTAFEHRDFFIAPYYAEFYPNMAIFDDESILRYDPDYYNTNYEFWNRHPKPTLEMLQNALPDGVLNDGGRISGFLYFEWLVAPEGKLWFRANLIGVKSGQTLGTVSIPFAVTEESLMQ